MPFLSPKMRLKLAKSIDVVKTHVTTAAEFAKSINDMGNAPGVHNFAALGVLGLSKVVNALDSATKNDPDAVFRMSHSSIADIMIAAYKLHPNTEITVTKNATIVVHPLEDGYTLLFKEQETEYGTSASAYVYGVRGDKQRKEYAYDIDISSALWEVLGNTLYMAECPTTDGHNYTVPPDVITPLSQKLGMPSDQGRWVLDRVRKFEKAGFGRGILLYGEPGTGKSTMGKFVAQSLQDRALVVGSGSLPHASSLVINFVKHLKPNAIIIDDIDRIKNVESLLNFIDTIRRKVKILVVTANEIDRLPAAVLRAGRFDDHIEVTPEITSEHFIRNIPVDLRDEVRHWPVAFIQELENRINILGEEEARSEFELLEKRVKDNKRPTNV